MREFKPKQFVGSRSYEVSAEQEDGAAAATFFA